MAFKITARTILHLGAELISSDAIAFYELIKNAFDAKSEHVDINVVYRMKLTSFNALREKLIDYSESEYEVSDELLQNLKDNIVNNIDGSSFRFTEYKNRLFRQNNIESLIKVFDGVNYISINDTGDGMSHDDLNGVYLTIGTRSRLKERELQRNNEDDDAKLNEEKSRPILGEKGVGRLSVMRLGDYVRVKSKKYGEDHWNLLKIDWSQFSHDSDKFLHEIEIAPERIDAPLDGTTKGTKIKITRLTSEWSLDKLQGIARNEFSKLTDPFTPQSKYPIRLRYNNQPVLIPPFNTILFDHAHACVEAELTIDKTKGPVLSGLINYKKENRKKTFSVSGRHLTSCAGVSDNPHVLESLGKFNVEFYWYNRQKLTGIDGIGIKKQVTNLVNDWSGGLMVFRDGFRVNPYGSPNDDWLDLDRRALASSGYKVNRKQLIGKVDISKRNNQRLYDQTNREGLRDCPEKEALKNILNHVIITEFKRFMEEVDREIESKDSVDTRILEEKIEQNELKLNEFTRYIANKYPELNNTNAVKSLKETISDVKLIVEESKRVAKSFEKGRSELVHLAGLGLMVEILGHELNRATLHTLNTLSEINDLKTIDILKSKVTTLEAQLKTLQKRIQILDPLGTAARQRKEKFDLVQWIKEIIITHDAQFKRHNIICNIDIVPINDNKPVIVNMVKGMVVQILENLISNSVYWMKQERIINKKYIPSIDISIDKLMKRISITDNGPGVDLYNREAIFKPFVTTKPPGEGKGLGLYLSREIAEYHDSKLYLLDTPTVHNDKLNTFVIELEAAVQ